jgi:phosphomannomutase
MLGKPVARTSAARGDSRRSISCPAYLKAIESFTRSGCDCRSSGMKFGIDSMYGAGGRFISEIFTRLGVAHVQIRGNVDPLFPGINPEPIEPHIRALGEAVVANGCQAGLCTDGDADRIGATDEHGTLLIRTRFFACC